MSTNPELPSNGLLPDEVRRARADRVWWSAAGLLWRWRLFLVGVPAAVGVAAAAITWFLMPNYYAASATLLPPEGGGAASPLAAQLLRDLPSAATALLGGTSSEYHRYLTILDSRRLLEGVVDTFELVEVYELEEEEHAREKALVMLREYAYFEVDEEMEHLSVGAIDGDPVRAAAMANYMVRRLNAINAELSTQSARLHREQIEGRYLEAQADLDSLADAYEAFQTEYGLYSLEAQVTAFMEAAASMAGQVAELEIQRDRLRQQFGEANPRVQDLNSALAAARRKYDQALAGGEAILPVGQAEMPEVLRAYVDLERERLIQQSILEVVAPLYEQARFTEEQRVEAVQVVDRATPPVEKAGPRRSIICIGAALSAFVLALVFVLAYTWWQRNHAYLSRRIREAAAEPVPERV